MFKEIIFFGVLILVLLKFILPKFPNIIKYIIYSHLLVLASLSALPFMLPRLKDYRNVYMPLLFTRIVGWIAGVTVEVRGYENVNKSKGNVTIMNHQSNYDCLAIAYLYQYIGRFTTICKKELLYVPFFGAGLYFADFIFIDRSKRSSSIEALHKQSSAIREKEVKIMIFPEGTRNLKGQLLPFKKGAFHLAIEAKCSIQPIILSPCYYAKGFGFVENPKMIVKILPEISTSNYNSENVGELVKLCQEKMQNAYDELSVELNIKKIRIAT